MKNESAKKQTISSHFARQVESEVDLLKTTLVQRIMEMPLGELSEFISPVKAAKIIGISMPTLRKYTREGMLTRYRLGCKLYYRRDEIEGAFKKDEFKINRRIK